MNDAIAFAHTDGEWQRIIAHRPWALYFYGGKRALAAEERCQEGYTRFSAVDEVLCVGVARSHREVHAHFAVECGNREAETKIGWSQLAEAIRYCLGQTNHHPHIVFDVTSLELDTILYLVPQLLQLKPASLFGLYLAPESYPMKEKGLTLQSIQQPRGYVSFDPGLEGARRAHHYIITGFDQGRAQRYIDTFDWDRERLHGVIGNPAFVDQGEETAWRSNQEWLDRLQRDFPGNIHEMDAAGPKAVREFFRGQFSQHEMLDIVPLGPKPMLLGVLLFYLGLAEEERGRVRILFDFPTPKAGCTQGVAKGFLFDCGELLTP